MWQYIRWFCFYCIFRLLIKDMLIIGIFLYPSVSRETFLIKKHFYAGKFIENILIIPKYHLYLVFKKISNGK